MWRTRPGGILVLAGLNALFFENVGDVALLNALSQAFSNGGLTDTRFTDQHRVVLGTAAEDLNRAADLFIATDDRIELAVAGGCGEIATVFLQGFIGSFRVLIGHVLAATHGIDSGFQGCCVHADLVQQPLPAALIISKGEQQVLDGDVAVAIALFEAVCTVEPVAEAFAEIDRLWSVLERWQLFEVLFNPCLKFGWRGTCFLENAVGQAILLEQCQQQMLGFDLLVSLTLRQVL